MLHKEEPTLSLFFFFSLARATPKLSVGLLLPSSTFVMDRVQQTLKVMASEPVKSSEPVDQDNFACNVFTDREIASRVPKATYKAYKAAVKSAKSLEPNHADCIATAMKDWAVEHGATHFTHWFQPIHISTAEKHEAFLTPRGDDFHVIRVRYPLILTPTQAPSKLAIDPKALVVLNFDLFPLEGQSKALPLLKVTLKWLPSHGLSLENTSHRFPSHPVP